MTYRYLSPDEAAREAERLITDPNGYTQRYEALVDAAAERAEALIRRAQLNEGDTPQAPRRLPGVGYVAGVAEPIDAEEVERRMSKLEADSVAAEIAGRLSRRENGRGLRGGG